MIETTCIITRFFPDRKEKGRFILLGQGFIRRHPNDPFNKGLGRRLALRKALKQVERVRSQSTAVCANQERDAGITIKNREQVVWKPYFEQHSDMRQGMMRVPTTILGLLEDSVKTLQGVLDRDKAKTLTAEQLADYQAKEDAILQWIFSVR